MLLEDLNNQNLEMPIIILPYHAYVQNVGHLQEIILLLTSQHEALVNFGSAYKGNNITTIYHE